MVKVNLNDFIKVKLNEHGRDIYYHRFDEVNEVMAQKYGLSFKLESTYPTVDEKGFTDIQLHEFIHIFGKHLFNGGEIVSEDNSIYVYEM